MLYAYMLIMHITTEAIGLLSNIITFRQVIGTSSSITSTIRRELIVPKVCIFRREASFGLHIFDGNRRIFGSEIKAY